ncbi:AbrB/MazE/SpoVT family DNA-binding domain-containing protein [Candidatus Magnetobacterium casense]|uniref:AbrB/MazE/SpoVT family DNA-binding domain-containing protein n=1 Tax=Candidatus Magnetobacterium casense TaxID=1455061 RepID=A0ABS6S4A5_9BACT|nr:AbrB/MazE/SpoVT family DNA-binding domain-containing protein [Candidatus Magnetobacterium casensis]MBV6343194.1 AbrB/MazE/SpoVT family DNA-binding domain-containing protein [Candidatus Magnetobacterium casensis]
MSQVKVNNKFQVTIPAEIREKAHIKEGDVLEVVCQDKTIVFKPRAVSGSEGIDAAIAEGVKDYQEGRVFGPFDSIEEFKAALYKI